MNEWYMNELKPYSNKSDFENRMNKKVLKELEVTTYTNKMHFLYRWLNYRNSVIKRALLEKFYIGWSSCSFLRMHVSEDNKTCWKDSLNPKQSMLGNVTMSSVNTKAIKC